MVEKQRRITLGALKKNGTDGFTISEKVQAEQAVRSVSDGIQKVSEQFANSTRQAMQKVHDGFRDTLRPAAAKVTFPAYDVAATVRGVLDRPKLEFENLDLRQRLLKGEVIEVQRPPWLDDFYAAKNADKQAEQVKALTPTQTRTAQIAAVLAKHGGNKTAAALELGVDRKVIYRHTPKAAAKKTEKTNKKNTANRPFG